jgi:signal transduction histidine kinase
MNAIYFRDETKPANLCKLSVQEQGSVISFQIEDNGIGIEPEYHESIFEMFFKASQRSDGAGLGLYLVKEAVRKLKGTISVQSTPGIGSIFSITIPNLKST